MRLTSLVDHGRCSVALVDELGVLPITMPHAGLDSLRSIAASGAEGLRRIHAWAALQPTSKFRPLAAVTLGPAVAEPGAIYAVGLNYAASEDDEGRPERPLIYAKLPSSVAGPGEPIAWDRELTSNVDAEVELGVVIGRRAYRVPVADAPSHVFGFTCLNDVSSRDPWLDGDQWLLGKSMPGFCPVGPWVVTADELAPDDLRLRCAINGAPIQDGRTSQMRFPIAELIAYISRHVELRPGDLIATGTPPRLPQPPGPNRHLEPGDVVTVAIDGIGELTTPVA